MFGHYHHIGFWQKVYIGHPYLKSPVQYHHFLCSDTHFELEKAVWTISIS